MSNFWNNLCKFPRFLTSVLVGFFLTTFKPVFKLLKNKKRKIIFIIATAIIIRTSHKILMLMTGI
uniref:Uncharacterized protein ycf33 n=1 Tax=Bostrychia simpliciuscula TaxID=324754 RepID=A0A1Z1M7U3_9FLOR|nr:hypothetical protein [Bostrychia simpliciuscula]ARW62158.1 hypothetical protein [Bostrychia simpliciuscula]